MRRLGHLIFGLDQKGSFLVAVFAVAAAVADDEEVQLDLACASGLVDGSMEHKIVASVE